MKKVIIVSVMKNLMVFEMKSVKVCFMKSVITLVMKSVIIPLFFVFVWSQGPPFFKYSNAVF